MAAHDGMKKFQPKHPDASHKPGFHDHHHMGHSISKGVRGGDKGPSSPKKMIGAGKRKV